MSSEKLEIGDVLILNHSMDLQMYFPLVKYKMLDGSIRHRSIFYFDNEDEYFKIIKLPKDEIDSMEYTKLNNAIKLKSLFVEFIDYKVANTEIKKHSKYNYSYIEVYNLQKNKEKTELELGSLKDNFINFSDYL